jgi:hypothetical protein
MFIVATCRIDVAKYGSARMRGGMGELGRVASRGGGSCH